MHRDSHEEILRFASIVHTRSDGPQDRIAELKPLVCLAPAQLPCPSSVHCFTWIRFEADVMIGDTLRISAAFTSGSESIHQYTIPLQQWQLLSRYL